MQHELSGLLITSPTDLYYLLGVRLSRGVLLITPTSTTLWIDPRYSEAVQHLLLALAIQCHSSSEETYVSVGQTLQQKTGPIGFDTTTMTVEKFQGLSSNALPGQLVAAPSLFSQLRRPKQSEEIAAIEEACRLCEQGFVYLLGQIREGVTEEELSRALKAYWFANSAEAISFEPIIAFGPHTACPHWTSSATPLTSPSIILIDIGVQRYSYQSDMSRTFFFGREDSELLTCHTLVQEAYWLAFSHVRPGVSPASLDGLVRDFFSLKGYGQAFVHSLGHGVGLEVHEPPRLSSLTKGEHPLEVGDVFTIEPGLYLPNRGGVRIENTIVVEPSGARSLFTADIKPVCLF